MPALDGRELCRILKSNPETRGIKVVIMTSLYKSLRHETEAIHSFGADRFLRKPFTISELRMVIGSLLPQDTPATSEEAGQPVSLSLNA